MAGTLRIVPAARFVTDPQEANRNHQQATSSNAHLYTPTAVPSLITTGGVDHSPVTPVGLDARRKEQIDAVIRQLTRDDHEIPSPFSKRQLYRTAASVGIEVWKPTVKDRFTEHLLDRLNYEWDSTSRTFVPTINQELIEDIQLAAGTITQAFETELSGSLRKRIAKWCDLHGLDSLEAVQSAVARHAVLSVLLKTALYEWYQCRGVVPPLPDTVQQALQNAREQTEDPAFDPFILDDVADLADKNALESVVAHRERLLYSAHPTEDIGRLYSELTPSEHRQLLGQFRTPPAVADTMQSWVVRGGGQILDPGMGAGVLSSPYHQQWTLDTDPAHVTGIDRSPLARLAGSTALTLAGQANDTLTNDFLDVTPNDLPRDIDGIVCNPAYTSGDMLPKEYKYQINANIEETTGNDVSARSPLYTYFLYHARSFLSPGDRAAFLTPDSFLTTNYGQSLKRFLLDEFTITALVQFNPDGESIFDDAKVTALISFLEARSESDAGETRFISVDESIDTSILHDAVQNGEQGKTDWGFINVVEQADLSPEENWAARFDPCNINTSALTPLGEFAAVHCGKSTGDVTFFCLSQNDVDEYEIPDKHLCRLIRRPKLVDGYGFRRQDWKRLREAGKEVWLLDPDTLPTVPESVSAFRRLVENDTVPVPGDEPRGQANTIRYLRRAVTEWDLTGKNKLNTRPCWYRPRRQDSPHVIVQDSGRDGFNFVINETEARNIHNYHGLYDVEIDETELKALLAYLNSNIGQQVIRAQTQTQQGGHEKLSISTLKTLPVIDPTSLQQSIAETLADLFDELRETDRDGRDRTAVLECLDSLLQQVM